MHVQPRTIRYYISEGLLPPPSGGPKFARYGLEHLGRVVAIRRWVDQGISLEQAAEMIKAGQHGGETDTHQRRPMAPLMAAIPRSAPEIPMPERTIRKLSLTEHSVLEIDSQADYRRELQKAAEAISKEIKRLSDTT